MSCGREICPRGVRIGSFTTGHADHRSRLPRIGRMAAYGERATTGQAAPVGVLGPQTPAAQNPLTSAFVQRLRELGWIEDRTVTIEYRWAEGRSERYADFAAEFVALKVDLIITNGTATVFVVKRATSVIPIVFASAGDPV